MMMKKTVLATAVAFALAGSPVWAATTTTAGKFILDKTEVNAGGVVNLALMGLAESSEVDRFAEQGGFTIVATVSSEKGNVIGGADHPDSATAGSFAQTVRYVKLTQGNGRVYISYPADVTGEDTISITLQARSGSAQSGFTYENIPGASATKTVTIVPVSTAPGKLDISAFTPAPVDTNGAADTDASNGINAAMTAGVAGGQVTVKAKNPNAAGTITLTILGASLAGENVVYTQPMSAGQAIFTLDNQVVKAGVHKVEASMDGADSVDLIYADNLTVSPTGLPKAVELYAEYTKAKVLKPDDSLFNATTGACQATTALACQGIKVSAKAVDEYGNLTTNKAGSDILLSIRDTATEKVVGDTALSLKIDAATGKSSAVTGDKWVGNAKDELIRLGTASLVATPVDSNGTPLSTISPSDALSFEAVSVGINAVTLPNFTSAPIAGTEVKSAFNVTVIDAKGNVNTAQPASLISITNLSSTESLEVNRKSDPTNVNDVDLLFQTATNSPSTYLISDAAGNYGQVVVEGAPGVQPAALTDVKIVNAHGYDVTSIAPSGLSSDETYTVSIPEVIFKMADQYGNPVTGNPITEDITGQFRIASSNGTPVQADGDFGVPGRDAGKNATVTYAASGETPFAGEDSIAVSFTKPGLGSKQLTVTTTIPKLQSMQDISTYIEQTDIPVNSEVAMTVEVLDQDGDIFVDSDPTKNTVVKINVTGSGDKPINNPVIREIVNGVEQTVVAGQSLNFSETNGRKTFVISAGAVEGQFTVSFADAAGTVASDDRVFNVTRVLEEVCSENNLEVCSTTTNPTCEDAGGFYDEGATACRFIPIIEEGVSGIGADGNPTTSAAKIRGGCSVNSGDVANNAVAGGLLTPMKLLGVVEADPADVGKEADIIFLAETTDANQNSFFYSIYTQGLEANTDADGNDDGFNDFTFEGLDLGLRLFVDADGLALPFGDEAVEITNYEPFQTVTLKARQSYELFDWNGGVGQQGSGRFFIGYRLTDTGEIVFNTNEIGCSAQPE
ncbi:hypothetical protein [Candidatus Albibeggiatoa sp. nov. NOAA]|uniref:hypothetical protein n=1 Tax=Candidatus Albibeggiatoa sp. nov. NOAA TaxID=3162724 RepID=UPI0032FC905B|nr:hypothetical protein [Thiotrichaceae bacterium]